MSVSVRFRVAMERSMPDAWNGEDVQMPVMPRVGEAVESPDGDVFTVSSVGWVQGSDGSWTGWVRVA